MATGVLTSLGADPLRPRPPGGMGRGALLALGVHGLLVLALALSVRWHSQTPQTFSAELWSAVPQIAAPRAAESTPPPPPPPPPPAPTPKPAPVVPPRPAPAPPPAPEVEAQIAVEKARQAELAKAEREKAERERLERERAERARLEREKADKLAREKAERERIAQAKAEAEAKARAKAEAEARERELQAQREAKEKREQEQRLTKQREDYLKHIQGLAGATGAPGSTGTALRDAAPSANYAGRLIARIKPNIVLTDPVPGNPAADVEVRAAPSGTILSRRLVKSSGNKEWDEAVLRAIDRTGELPRDVDGRIPPVMVITFTPS